MATMARWRQESGKAWPSVFVSALAAFIATLCRPNLHLGALLQTKGAAGDDHVVWRETADDLHVFAVADAKRDGFLMRIAVRSDHHHRLAPVLRSQHCGVGNLQRILVRFAGDGSFHWSADLQLAGFVVDLEPDFNRGASRIERRTDQ